VNRRRPPPDPLAGTAYRTLAPLGRGGMGEVVEAEHVALGRRVVIKILHRRLAGTPGDVDRMRLEGQTLAQLEHPNLVAVTDLQVTADGRPFLVMERLRGRTLRDELAERGALPAAEAIALGRQALAGLGAAHAAGVVHRDVTLQNLFLCDPRPGEADRVLKVLDFGLAKVVGAGGGRGPAPLAVSTDEGVALGTPRFFSPEQASFGPVDARTDLYAAGAVIYTLVAGRGPFEHRVGLKAMVAAHAHETPEPPSRWAPSPLPPGLDEALLRALQKRPGDRFQSAAAFADALAVLRPRPRWPRTEPMSPVTPAPPESWPRTEPMSPVTPAPPEKDRGST
jgi:eukaryotic-like serine/threonine-protein kinase